MGKIDYYPFGDIRLNENNGQDEQRKFTGHMYGDDTDLNYMVTRYQDPAIGRFASIDPVHREPGDLRKINITAIWPKLRLY